MSQNAEVARRLEEFADLLDAQDIEYKPRAYRRAAENVRDHPRAIEDLVAEGDEAVMAIEGVGEAIGEKIVEYVETGSIEELEEEREKLPVDMAGLTSVEGIGPKTVGALFDALGVTTLDDLETAAKNEEIRTVSGFGPKTEQNILESIEFARSSQKRRLLGETRPVVDDVFDFLDGVDAVERAEVAGSIRRWLETIGDVDVLVATDDGESVAEAAGEWSRVEDVIESGEAKASVRVEGLRVDFRFVQPIEFGSALQYFTGSKDHNIRLRNYAIARDMKVNEYGVFDVSNVEDSEAGQRTGERLASETEEDVYEALGLSWIPPELREDTGEIDAAGDDTLPDLLEEDHVRGDLHTHTDWSDGVNTVEEMIRAAEAFGHEYLCISDHAEGPGVFGDNGLDDDAIREQLEVIHTTSDRADIDVFAGIEANIDKAGEVGSVSDDVLLDLDLVVASPHSGLGDGEDQTERLTRAMDHPAVDVLGHPSGRLINQRPAMEIDPDTLGNAAAANGVALEVNANPQRLDLWGSAVKAAIEADATIVINTDAHSPAEYDYMRYGVHTARRGWAEPDVVLNTWDVDDVRSFLH
ncbi:MAG: DNA polymerase/3'-5' exonuclease PolX [Halodesulfurarchaeum sp.]